MEASGPWSFLLQLGLCLRPSVTRIPRVAPKTSTIRRPLSIPASVSLLFLQRPLHSPLPTWPEFPHCPLSRPRTRQNEPLLPGTGTRVCQAVAATSRTPWRAGGPQPPLQTRCPRPRGLQRPAEATWQAEAGGSRAPWPGPSPGPSARPRPRPAAGPNPGLWEEAGLAGPGGPRASGTPCRRRCGPGPPPWAGLTNLLNCNSPWLRALGPCQPPH